MSRTNCETGLGGVIVLLLRRTWEVGFAGKGTMIQYGPGRSCAKKRKTRLEFGLEVGIRWMEQEGLGWFGFQVPAGAVERLEGKCDRSEIVQTIG